MTLDSPILGLVALPLAVLALAAAGRSLPAAARWLFRVGIVALLAAIAGASLRCERPQNIAVLVDVSPSTRGATFRDALSVATRLTPLLAGRPYTTHYFADGLQPTADEPPAARTRLEAPPGVDAIVLLSDGRFVTPAALPPVFVVYDPELRSPVDARVRDLRERADGHGVVADVVATGGANVLRWAGAEGDARALPRGPAVVAAVSTAARVTARLDAADAWPENDTLTLDRPTDPIARWAAGTPVAGFDAVDPRRLPTDAADYLGVAAVTLSTRASVSPAQQAAIAGYVRELGGTLVLAGPPAATPPGLRALAPLSAVPPAGPQSWVVLLDASGSMAAPAGAGANAAPGGPAASRWAAATSAAAEAIDRLPDDARVRVLRFAGDVRTIVADAAPVAARQALAAATADAPTGPTGLRAALAALAGGPAAGPTRVLLLTDGDADLGDVAALAAKLNSVQLRLDAVTSTPAAGLSALCVATGGRVVEGVPAADWSEALGGLAGGGDAGAGRVERLIGRGPLATRAFDASDRWPAFTKADASVLLAAAGGDAVPAAAAGSVGVGTVVSVAATLSPGDLAAVATTLERPATDPRFDAVFDTTAGVARLTARDAAGPMNGLTARLTRAGVATPFAAVAPGTYEAPLDRRPDATLAVVTVEDAVVARRSIAGRYAAEFDVIGNDRPALDALARDTGGAVIEVGDERPIEFAVRRVGRPVRPVLVPLAAGLMTAGVLSLRRRAR